jgi:hypothetical protein
LYYRLHFGSSGQSGYKQLALLTSTKKVTYGSCKRLLPVLLVSITAKNGPQLILSAMNVAFCVLHFYMLYF